jgi:murein DD-endopeptidase MepM/ murein hydrolase activator NlpD
LRAGAALVAVICTIVAAMLLAPQLATGKAKPMLVSEEIALPAISAPNTDSEVFRRETQIRRGDTLASLFARLKLNDAPALNFLSSAPAARAFAQLIPGRAFRAEAAASGRLHALHYQNGEVTHSVVPDGDAFAVRDNRDAPVQARRVISVSGVIKSALFAATDAANIPDSVAVQIAEIFSTDIDFHKDLRKGDRFTVVYEMITDGETQRAGRVLSAEFSNLGRLLNAVWFDTGESDGKGEYYTLEGRNIRKAFLRSPLEFSRITSGFAMRFHPILHTWRAHNGVDYAAPVGTKIRSTADGVVDFAGVQQGYGNVVILRHLGKYTTLYAHLQGFAPGIRKGARVRQGDTIGTVGMTGMTTGPHVHYEFRVNEVHVDPLSVAVPQSFPIEPRLRARFEQTSAPLAKRLVLLREVIPGNFE